MLTRLTRNFHFKPRRHYYHRVGLLALLTVCWISLVVVSFRSSNQQQIQRVSVETERTTPASTALSGINQSSLTWPPDCDVDCRRFQRLLAEWKKQRDDVKPRAVIYYLVHSRSLSKLNKSIHQLDANFNNRFQYPVVVFVELDTAAASRSDVIQTIRSFTGSDPASQSRLFVQVVEFHLPDFLTRPVPPRAGNGKSVGYRHMCRFHAKTIYQQPIFDFRLLRQQLQSSTGNGLSPTAAAASVALDYSWRFDDDSLLLEPVEFDPFIKMRDSRRLQYGFVQIRTESRSLIRGLWESVDTFLSMTNRTQIRPTDWYKQWQRSKIFYNNFELSDWSVWTSRDYQELVDYIDRQGGIYYQRWGDAPIRTIAVTLLVEKSRTHRFDEIAYKHSSYSNIRGRRRRRSQSAPGKR